VFEASISSPGRNIEVEKRPGVGLEEIDHKTKKVEEKGKKVRVSFSGKDNVVPILLNRGSRMTMTSYSFEEQH